MYISKDEKPFPFIVGVGRSGTTLLRLMIDAHPEIAIPPETHWFRGTLKRLREPEFDADGFKAWVSQEPTWQDLDISEDTIDEITSAHDPADCGATFRKIYRCYADKHHAQRFGDKTPAHGSFMVEIEKVLPEARFIHIIRDGRDVALSYRGLRFGPGDDAGNAAKFWKSTLLEIRRQGAAVKNYTEVRYEDLINSPEPVLREIGDFIDLPFSHQQLDAHLFAASRLGELKTVSRNGRTLTSEQRQEIHLRTKQKPDKGRIGRWKAAMTDPEVKAFETVAGDLLDALAYR